MAATAPAVTPEVFAGRPVERPLIRTLRRFRRHRMAVVGVTTIAILVILAVIGDEAAALKQSLANANKAPSAEYWFGTDRNGRDVFARTLVGGRVSLAIGLIATVFSTVIGTVLGAIAGYYRTADLVIMRIVDIVMSFPTIVLLLIAVAVVGPGIGNLMVMIGLITWPIPCRIVRGQFLLLREADYVTAARVIGQSDFAIVTPPHPAECRRAAARLREPRGGVGGADRGRPQLPRSRVSSRRPRAGGTCSTRPVP